MRILKPKLNSKLIRRILILGFSLAIITTAIAPKPDRPPGKVAGTATNPLLIENKFCTDPGSGLQTGCTNFISTALAQAISIYQNVTGPVNISGKVEISGDTNRNDPLIKVSSSGLYGGGGNSDVGLVIDVGGNSISTSNLFNGKVGGSSKFIIKNNGNVGIGTASPGRPLEVNNAMKFTNTAGTDANDGVIGTGTFAEGLNIVGIQTVAGNGRKVQIWGSTTFVDGKVGIGTASPTYKLDVSGDIRSTGTIRANANGTSYLCGGDDACLKDVNIANTVGIHGVQNNGWGSVAAAAFNVQSSRRFKTNIRNSRYGLDAVLALQGVDFSYIDPNQAQDATGFIAEDVAGIYPYAVQYDNNGRASSLDYSKFAPLFVNAIKEQQKRIRSLLDIVDIVNKIGHFIQIETQRLIVNGVDILDKLNKQEQEINELKSTVQQLQQQLQNK